jgi:formyl-CoA transferase
MKAIGREDLADDPALAHNDGRVEHTERLDAAIAEWTLQRALNEALDVLDAAEVPCSAVYSAADIFADAHYRARGMIESGSLPDGSPIALPGIVPKLSATPGETRWIGPQLGEHTQEILASIGITNDELERLKTAGVV